MTRCLLAATMVLALACARKPAPPLTPADAPRACPNATKEVPLTCFVVRVPEREDSLSRTLDLHVVVAPARMKSTNDAIVFLAGGPGQAATEGVMGTLRALGPVRDGRDVVFVDQRGTGRSNPMRCDLGGPSATLRAWLTGRVEPMVLARCLRSLHADPAYYTSLDAARDLEAVRRSLGYERLDLIGVSYGSRAAMVYARQYPQRVRTMTLRGVSPPGARLPLYTARDADRALRRLGDACSADPACRSIDAHVYRDVVETLDALDASPRYVRLATDSIRLTRDVAATSLLLSLYQHPRPDSFATAVIRARRGDLDGLLGPGLLLGSGLAAALPMGMYLSVICSEDVALTRADDIAAATAGTFLGDALVRNLAATCAGWPRATLPRDYADPVRVDAPTLVISGEEDPVTPPSWGEDLVRGQVEARHLVLPFVGHVPWMTECARAVVRRFIETADASRLPHSCADAPRVTASSAAVTVPSPSPSAPPSSIADVTGYWDLYWTPAGASRAAASGALELCQRDTLVRARLHGQGSLEAEGSFVRGALTLRGRNVVEFVIAASAVGDELEGSLTVLASSRSFRARRTDRPPRCD